MTFIVSDEYLYGFIDGEGCFYIGIVPSKDTISKWQVIAFFKVSQNPQGKVILDFLKKKLQAGYVKPNDKSDSPDKSLAFVVRDFDSLIHKVIPYIDGKLVIKKNEFNKFKQVLNIIESKQHLNINGLSTIIDIAYSMNTKLRKIPKDFLITDISKRIPTDYTPKSR